MAFSEYLELALYDPEVGYYAQGGAVGLRGDFYTNVSIGPIFAEILLGQIEECWRLLGKPDPFYVIEQGAHHGEFAEDFLNAAQARPDFFRGLRYAIVEPLPRLAARQQDRLSSHRERTEWHSDLASLHVAAGVHWSNELLDALPFELIEWDGADWLERRVSLKDDQLRLIRASIDSAELREAVARLPRPGNPPYQTEIRLSHRGWLQALAQTLQRGFVLACDYGYPRDVYYAPERREGTLACYHRHHRTFDALDSPGERDLTAHVDFTLTAADAETAGFSLRGFTDQHHFLVHAAEKQLYQPGFLADSRRRKAFATLMHPELMGTRFHFLALSRNVEPQQPLTGFRSDPFAALGLKNFPEG